MIQSTTQGYMVHCVHCNVFHATVRGERTTLLQFCGRMILKGWRFFGQESPANGVNWFCPECKDAPFESDEVTT